jgi:Domain of unknown function (DUF4382)
MDSSKSLLALGIATLLLAACGGGSSGGGALTPSSGNSGSTPQTGNLSMMVSDASTEDWACIGVKILAIALVPQDGGANVTIYTAATPATTVNLAELDQISEILGNVTVPAGTYSGAVLTISGNPGDVTLVTAADPEVGFAAPAGATINANQIQIQHAQGSSGSLTVPVDVNFVSPLVVSANQNNALDLEFDLGHPAFIIGHVPPGSGTTLWAVNFDGPVRHRPLYDLSHLVLRHLYGSFQSISSDNSSISVLKEYATEPPASPETAVTGTQALQILVDSTNGTLLYDVDGQTHSVIMSFSGESGFLAGKQLRIAARYQEDGTLVATRIWASANFNSVWLSPEGHVLHVNPITDVVSIESESGAAVPVTVNAGTQFFFRQPQSALADSSPIATGTQFLSDKDLVRGFKVHVSVLDPLATPLVAQSIDIETAKYDGTISMSDGTGFTYARNFRTPSDDYQLVLDYISSSTSNGTDDHGNALSGYKWWNFAYPTLLNTGTTAISSFTAATGGLVNFGGSVGSVPAYGESVSLWNDPANPNGWAAAASILTPARLPLGTVESALMNNAFTMMVLGGANAATIELSTTSGSATLVYQVDRSNGVVTVSPLDITTSAGLMSLSNGLALGVPVKVYGIPQPDGSLKAYVLTYFTGEMPAA